MARRTLDPEFYASWSDRLRRAATGDDGTSLDDRKQAQLDLYTEVECDLELVGVTAVEDRLQDDVPECISFFLRAGIRFVMITGDKLETAENIAYSTKLFNTTMTVAYLADAKSIAHTEQLLLEAEQRAQEAPKLAIVVDGATLKYLLKQQAGLSDRFYLLLHRAAAVVCCRANPRIKAKVVQLVRNHNDKDITLAIGDGGNDVKYDSEGAHWRGHCWQGRNAGGTLVGLCHSAVSALEEACGGAWALELFAQQHHCAVLGLQEHGLYLCAVLVWFALRMERPELVRRVDCDAVQCVFHFVAAALFRFCRARRVSRDGVQVPRVVSRVPGGSQLFGGDVLCVDCRSIVHQRHLLLLFLGRVSGGHSFDRSHARFGLSGQPPISVFAITVVNLRIFLETRNVTWFIHLSYMISFGLLLLVLGIETIALSFTPTQYGVFEMFAGSGVFWLLYLLVVVTCLLPAFVLKTLISNFWPWDSQIAREMDKNLRNKRAVQLTSVASVSKLVPGRNDARQSQDDSDF